nr:vegetative cell wall protein gp1-like [Rhipicephalus microplus]
MGDEGVKVFVAGWAEICGAVSQTGCLPGGGDSHLPKKQPPQSFPNHHNEWPIAVILLAAACTAHAGNRPAPPALRYEVPASWQGYGLSQYNAAPAAPAYGPTPPAPATPSYASAAPAPVAAAPPQPAPYRAPVAPAPAPAPAPRLVAGYGAPLQQAVTSSYSIKTVHGAPEAPTPVARAPADPAPLFAAPPAPASYASPAAAPRGFANPGPAAAPVAYATPASPSRGLGAPAAPSFGAYPSVGYAATGNYERYVGSSLHSSPDFVYNSLDAGVHDSGLRTAARKLAVQFGVDTSMPPERTAREDTPRGDGTPDPIPQAVTWTP